MGEGCYFFCADWGLDKGRGMQREEPGDPCGLNKGRSPQEGLPPPSADQRSKFWGWVSCSRSNDGFQGLGKCCSVLPLRAPLRVPLHRC